MDIEEGKKLAREALAKGEKKLSDFVQVGKAVWKAGIPSRFWLFLFVVGIVLGVGVKYLSFNHFTIGYDDYRLLPKERVYDVNAAQERVMREGGALTAPEEKPTYPAENIDTDPGL